MSNRTCVEDDCGIAIPIEARVRVLRCRPHQRERELAAKREYNLTYAANRLSVPDRCIADGCERDSWSRKMCRMHYRRWDRANGGSHPPSDSTPRGWAANRFSQYGITEDDYDRMLIQQGGNCAICSVAMSSPFIDHNHATGAVRALLCRHCNSALGFLRDSPRVAIEAAQYLKRHSA